MLRKERCAHILAAFQAASPAPETELRYDSPFGLLVAVILSAQCTDRRVNTVTPALLERYPDADSLASATPEEVFGFIRSISFPNSKAAHLVGMAKKLKADFGGVVPSDVDSLMTLPGVGRKTANVIASIVYDKPVIAVDTHVFRVSRRLGLSSGKTPEAVEKDLEALIPAGQRASSHHWLILHGRYVCTARKPRCTECSVKDWCREHKRQQLGDTETV